MSQLPAVVAITGSSGFLGSALGRALEDAGSRVLPIRRQPGGGLIDPGGRADALVHLAFPTDTRQRHADPLGTLVRVSRDAAEASALGQRLGARHLVVLSSGKVYGAGTAWPADEATPTRPTTGLGHLKLAAEQLAAVAVGLAPELGVSLVRLFNAYGPGQRGDFLFPELDRQLRAGGPLRLGELDHQRDWIHIDDVTSGLLTTLAHPAAAGATRPLVLGSGATASVADLLELVRAARGSLPPVSREADRLRPAEPTHECGAPRALRALGWAPRVALGEGVRRLFWLGAGPIA